MIVMRSARSPLLKEAGDLSSALTDAQGRLIAQGRDIPMHMGVMGFTVKEFLKRVPAERLARGRRVVPQPARGRRQSPARREGGAPGLRRGPAGRLRDQPRPLGRHRRRRAGQLRAVGHRVATRKGCASRRSGCSRPRAPIARRSTSCSPTCAAATSARATSSPSSPPTTSPRAGSRELFAHYGAETDRRVLRAPARRVRDADARGHPRAARRRVGGRGLGRRRRRGRPPHPHPRARRQSRRRGAPSTSRGTDAAGARPGEHDVLHRLLVGVLRDESAGGAGRAAQRRLLPPAARPSSRRAPSSAPIPTARSSAAITRPRQRVVDAIVKALAPVLPDRVSAGGPDDLRGS